MSASITTSLPHTVFSKSLEGGSGFGHNFTLGTAKSGTVVKSCWNSVACFFKDLAEKIWLGLRTPLGLGAVSGCISLAFWIGSEFAKNDHVALALRITSVVFGVGAFALASLGAVYGFTPLF